MPPLQGQAQFTELRSDSAFMAAPVHEQVQYLRDSYLPQKDPAFAQAPRAEQEQYIHEAVLPQIAPIQQAQAPRQTQAQFNPMPQAQAPGPVQMEGDPSRRLFGIQFNGPNLESIQKEINARPKSSNQPVDILNAASLGGYPVNNDQAGFSEGVRQALSKQLKGFTLGYLDPYPIKGPMTPDQQFQANANQFLGTLPLYELGMKGFDKGLAAAGKNLLPYTTEMAQAAGVGSRFARPVMTALSQLQGPAMWAKMLRSGLPFGAIGAAESQPGHQLDIGRRAQAGGEGFLGGALLPPLEAAAGTVLKGGVKMVKNLFGQAQTPIKIAEDATSQYLHDLLNSGMSQGRIKYEMQKLKNAIPTSQLKASLEQLIQDIYDGTVKAAHVSEPDAKKLGAHIRQVENAVNAGRELKPADKTTINAAIKNIRTKAAMKAKVEARKISVANENHESFSPSARQDFEAQTAIQRLKDRQARQKIANENHEAFGPGWKQDKQATEIVARLKERKARQAVADENHESFSPSARQHVAGKKAAKVEEPAKPQEPKADIAQQKPVDEAKQLLYAQVKDAIPSEKEAVAEKINTALESGKKIKWEVAAERTGRSNEAAHVTKTGNIKITPTEFTPLYWSQTKSGEVFINGYNQRGHFAMHPIEDVHKILKTDIGEGFRGVYPNRALGPREYKLSDVENLGPRSEKGAVKTSEVKSLLGEISDVYKAENFNKFSKPVKAKLNAIRKKGRIDQLDMAMLAKLLENNKEELAVFCKLVGIHG